jgi:NADH-quinone oxidoreductase subunit N
MAAVSVYYYFRLIQSMYFKSGNATITATTAGFKYTLAALAGITILLGIFPNLLTYWLYF